MDTRKQLDASFALGMIPDDKFRMLSESYESEQNKLREDIRIYEAEQTKVRDKVLVHKAEKIDNRRVQKVEVYLNFVGKQGLSIYRLQNLTRPTTLITMYVNACKKNKNTYNCIEGANVHI